MKWETSKLFASSSIFWKGNSDNAEFERLLMLVRGLEA